MPISDFLRGLAASAAIVLAVGLAHPVMAGEKEDICKLQGEIMSAIQQARLDRVSKSKVVGKVMEDNPEWPAKLEDEALPQLVDFIYAMKRRDLKDVDLQVVTEQQCLDNWEQIKAMQGG